MISSGDMFTKRYRIVKMLGNGVSSIVFSVVDISSNSNDNVVVKIFRPIYLKRDPKVRLKEFYKEIKILKELNHTKIVKLYGYGKKGTVYTP